MSCPLVLFFFFWSVCLAAFALLVFDVFFTCFLREKERRLVELDMDRTVGHDDTYALLARLTGKAGIPRDDPLWQTLLTAKVPLQRGSSTSVADLEQITQNFCAQLPCNNTATGNFQTLLLCALDHLELAQAEPVTQAQLESACGAVMLVTIILRHMVETLEAEARPSAAHLQPRACAARTHTRERPCHHIHQNRVRSHSPRRTCCRTSSCRHRQTVRAPRSRRSADGSSRRC